MKVLAVENNPKLLKLLTHLLEKEGFETVSAEGGEEALKQYEAHKPDIICLDVLMEDISGIDVCKKIRETDKRVVVLMITSKSRPVDVEAGMEAGANDYIVKPFDLKDITSRMRDVAKGIISNDTPEKVGESFIFGDLTVFPAQLRAERGGEDLDLNFRDVAILQLLHGQKGQTVGNDALSAYCWAAQASEPEKAVQWYMDQLRKKIEADPDNPVLVRPLEGGYIHE